MPLRVGRKLAQLQQRKAAPIEPASLRLILDHSPLSSSTCAEELWVEINTNLDPNLPSRASREIKIHVYLKRQTSDSSWVYLRIENNTQPHSLIVKYYFLWNQLSSISKKKDIIWGYFISYIFFVYWFKSGNLWNWFNWKKCVWVWGGRVDVCILAK